MSRKKSTGIVEKGFVMISNKTWHTLVHLPSGTVCLAVYMCLLSHLNFKTGACFPSHELIATETGLSTRTVKKILDILFEHGVITWRSGTNLNGMTSANDYLLIAERETYIKKGFKAEDFDRAAENWKPVKNEKSAENLKKAREAKASKKEKAQKDTPETVTEKVAEQEQPKKEETIQVEQEQPTPQKQKRRIPPKVEATNSEIDEMTEEELKIEYEKIGMISLYNHFKYFGIEVLKNQLKQIKIKGENALR